MLGIDDAECPTNLKEVHSVEGHDGAVDALQFTNAHSVDDDDDDAPQTERPGEPYLQRIDGAHETQHGSHIGDNQMFALGSRPN